MVFVKRFFSFKFFLIGLVIFLVIAVLSSDEPQKPADIPKYKDDDTKLIPATIHQKGWQTPVKLEFNDAGWEDSPYITRDGSKILFFYHPYPNLLDPKITEQITNYVVYKPQEAIKKGIDGKIYYSNKPFKTKSVHPISKNKKYPTTQTAPYISLAGDLYYNSTKESFVQQKDVPVTVYKNNVRLDFGTGKDEGNIHLCEQKDEAWFDCPNDQNICVMKNATASNFKGKVELAPYPINAKNKNSVSDFQPFLTDDCNTLYFTSDRSGGTLAIYKTTRQNEQGTKWSKPVKFITHPVGVAEVSITADGTEMVFAQLFKRDDKSLGLDIWYSKRGEE